MSANFPEQKTDSEGDEHWATKLGLCQMLRPWGAAGNIVLKFSNGTTEFIHTDSNDPAGGVYLEYPDPHLHKPLWSSWDWRSQLPPRLRHLTPDSPLIPPVYQQLEALGQLPTLVADVAIFRKGETKAALLLEVCHSHPCVEKKVRALAEAGLKYYEISTEWFTKVGCLQTGVPTLRVMTPQEIKQAGRMAQSDRSVIRTKNGQPFAEHELPDLDDQIEPAAVPRRAYRHTFEYETPI